ncbi:MAG: glycosyltransferase family 39 protein [Thermomicrobiales bacterium]
MALRTGLQVDESRMAFLIETIAGSGLPKFHSDVFYLIGTPVGYLFAPLAWIFDGSTFITAIRMGHVVLATIGIYFVWRFVLELTGNTAAAVAVTIAATLDPLGIYWGTVAQPYSMLSLATLLVVYSAWRAMSEPDSQVLRRIDLSNPLVWLVIWLAIGSFTHYAIWLVIPGVIVASYLRWGKVLLRAAHPMRVALELSIIFPILVWMFGSWIGPGSGSSFNPGPPEFNQIWNNAMRLWQVDVNLGLWRSLYYGSTFSQFVPFLILLATGMIVGWYFLKERLATSEEASDPIPTFGIVLVLASYWGPLLIIANGSLSVLLIGVLPFGYMVIGLALLKMVPVWDIRLDRRRIRMAPPVIAAGLLLLPVVFYLIQGTRWQIDFRSGDPDYYEASSYIETVLQPDQLLLTPFPAIAWMEMGDVGRSRIVPLAGPKDGTRLASETRNLSSSRAPDYYVDYWTGKPAIGTTAQLCQFLLYVVPAPLILMDVDRLASDSSFRGDFATVINQGTLIISEGENGLQLRTPLTLDQWSIRAQELCGIAPAPA